MSGVYGFIFPSILDSEVAWDLLEEQKKAGSLANFFPSIYMRTDFPVAKLRGRDKKGLKQEEEGDEEVISVCELQKSAETLLFTVGFTFNN